LLRSLLSHLLADFVILVVLLAASAILPFGSFWLCRSESGGQIVFWVGPWTCAVWVLLVSQLVGSRFWLGAAHVRAWRTAHGGYLTTSLKATAWMFFGLIASYACELGIIFLLPPSWLAMRLFPLSTYAPVLLALAWCSRG
jgi:hypothetical protein